MLRPAVWRASERSPPACPASPSRTFQSGELATLAASAFSIAVVILAQSAAVARSFAQKNGYTDSVKGDLVGLSAANLASAFTSGFAINGSPPRTAAGDSSGSKGQVVNIAMAVTVALVLLFLTGLFEYIPSGVLDAVVFTIGIKLVKVGTLRAVGRTQPARVPRRDGHPAGGGLRGCGAGDLPGDHPVADRPAAPPVPPRTTRSCSPTAR